MNQHRPRGSRLPTHVFQEETAVDAIRQFAFGIRITLFHQQTLMVLEKTQSAI